MSIFSPSLEDISKLPTSLNPGEVRVLQALKQLDDEWRIYVQPMLLMDNPDFVAVHNRYGVCAIEVKDWARGIYRSFGNGTIEVYDGTRWNRTAEAPRFQAYRYRNTIFEHFFASPESGTQDFPVVRSAVILPQYSTQDARSILVNARIDEKSEFQRVDVWGGDSLDNRLIEILTGYKTPTGMRVPQQGVTRLERQLAEPEVVADQRQPLVLSDGAANLEKNPNRAKIRRARGPAGSGKSLGLAARAARLAKDGKSVLVISFNITLPHYLHDLAARHGRQLGVKIRNIVFTHFHGLCSRAISDGAVAGVEGCEFKRSTSEFMERADFITVFANATNAYKAGVGRRFDAILVDEGQDFIADWWNFLRAHVLREEGEMLLVADTTQDLYDRAAWTAEATMKNCGFRGDWTDLQGCYRMPPDLIPIIARFGELYLKGGAYDPPVLPDDHPMHREASEPTKRRWTNLDNSQGIDSALKTEILDILNSDGLSPADIVFLCEEHHIGLEAAKKLGDSGVYVSHVFTDNDGDERRRRKHRFWGGMDGVKGCTVHSFKGWEARGVVLCILPHERSRRLAYVALTRIKGFPGARAAISVINCDPTLNTFKTEFEREFSVNDVPALVGQRRLF